ncbi:MAG: protease inhibitor I42 family protein [Polyangiaceae bacterium]
MRLSSFLVLVPLALSLAACSGATADSASDPASEDALKKGSFVDVTDADDNKTVTVEQGKTVRLTLAENGTTGYRWSIVSTDKSFGYPAPKDGTPKAPSSNAVGAGGSRVFEWGTGSPFLEPGSAVHQVKLEYRRPFEPASKPAAKKFTLKVKIKTAGAPEPADIPDLKIDSGEDGKTVKAKVGQKVVLSLAENPSTGYSWHVVKVDDKLGEPGEDFDGPGADGPVGSGGTAIFFWNMNKDAVGKREIKMKKSRGENGAAAETFDVTLDVAE